MRTLSNTENIDGMYQFQGNNPVQDYNTKMPFKFKWNKRKAFCVNPGKYGNVQAANSMLKTINFNLRDIKDWAILDSGAKRHYYSST